MPQRPVAERRLLSRLRDLHRLVKDKAEEAGFERHLAPEMNVALRGIGFEDSDSLTMEIDFSPGLGLDHRITTVVTHDAGPWPISSPSRRETLARAFVEHMTLLLGGAEERSRRRGEIARVTREVAAEAAVQGLELELLRIEPAPILVVRSPDPRRRTGDVFYVHVMMPHVDDGAMTRDVYVIDADDPEEFASYLRHRTIPELLEQRRAFAADGG